MSRTKWLGYGAALLSTVLLGTEGIFVRNVDVSAAVMTFARLGIGFVFLFVFLLLRRQIPKPNRITLSFPMMATGVLLSATSLCYISAIQLTTLANAVFLLYLGPLLAVGIAALLMKEKFTLLSAFFLGLAFLGFCFLLEFDFSLSATGTHAMLWGLASAVCYAMYIVINRNIPHDVSTSTRTFYQLLIGTAMLIPFLDDSIRGLSTADIYWLIALGFGHGFLAFTMIIYALKYLKAVEYGTISYIEPLMATGFGIILYAETLSNLQIIGCTIIFTSGIFQVSTTKSKS